MNKQELRKIIKQKRAQLDIENISLKLCKKLKQTSVYKNAKNILIYYPLNNEINLLELQEDKSKNYFLPKIESENLLCCEYKIGDKLCESCFKTKEPITESKNKNTIDLAIIPALCCDEQNFRLGYGGGFYDRFLSDFNGKKIVCLPKELIVKTVYPEPHDIPADLVITE